MKLTNYSILQLSLKRIIKEINKQKAIKNKQKAIKSNKNKP